MFKFQNLGIFLAVIFILTSCNLRGITGSGIVETREYSLSGFQQVSVTSAFEVEIIASDSFSVEITTDDNIFEYLKVEIMGERLNIGVKPFINLYNTTELKATIRLPEITRLNLSGASSGTVNGSFSGSNLAINFSGASSLTQEGSTYAEMTIVLSGASSYNANNMTITQINNCDISGSSCIDLQNSTTSRIYSLNISGASTGIFNLNNGGTINGSISGASTLKYRGNVSVNVASSGASQIVTY